MSRLLWGLTWVGVAIWSLFAFAAYGLVDLVGQTAMRNADAFSTNPETVEWIFGLFSWGRGLSVSVILVVWGTVSLAMLAVPWLFDRLVRRQPVQAAHRPARDGVIDLGPGDYSVGPVDPARREPVPQIGRSGRGW